MGKAEIAAIRAEVRAKREPTYVEDQPDDGEG